MADDVEFRVEENRSLEKFDWDEAQTVRAQAQALMLIARIEIVFHGFPTALSADLAANSELENSLRGLYQDAADRAFGKEKVIVQLELRAGSLTVVVLLATTGTFFRDYQEIRGGLTAFVKDVKTIAPEAGRIISKVAKGITGKK